MRRTLVNKRSETVRSLNVIGLNDVINVWFDPARVKFVKVDALHPIHGMGAKWKRL